MLSICLAQIKRTVIKQVLLYIEKISNYFNISDAACEKEPFFVRVTFSSVRNKIGDFKILLNVLSRSLKNPQHQQQGKRYKV